MKSLGRRFFAGLVASAPAAAAMADHAPAPVTPAPDPWGLPSLGPMHDKAWAAVNDGMKEIRSQDDRREVMREYYHGPRGIDPDIAALKSISPVHRARMQADRNARRYEKSRSLKARICAAFGVDPEMF